MSKMVCDLITIAYTQFDYGSNPDLCNTLERIRERAQAMDDRLAEYGKAIEDLGFKRDRRDYD